jgi:hypothetical protein
MTHSDIFFVPATSSRLRVMRKGHNIIRKERIRPGIAERQRGRIQTASSRIVFHGITIHGW